MNVNTQETGGLLVKLEGSLNMDSVVKARNFLLGLTKKSNALSLDFSDTVDIDTAAVALMVEVAGAIKRQGGQLSVFGLSERARQLIRLASLDSIF
jgi:anti-anti-sigma factor